MSYLLGGGMQQVRTLPRIGPLVEAVFRIVLLPENLAQPPPCALAKKGGLFFFLLDPYKNYQSFTCAKT